MPRCRWEDNVRLNFKEVCVITMDWVDSARYRDNWRALMNAALNLQVP